MSDEYEVNVEAPPESADAYYEDVGGDESLDPFAEDFGEKLGQTVSDAVHAGFQNVLGEEYAEPVGQPETQEFPAELTEEDAREMNASLDRAFDQIAAQVVGPFDRNEAASEAALI